MGPRRAGQHRAACRTASGIAQLSQANNPNSQVEDDAYSVTSKIFAEMLKTCCWLETEKKRKNSKTNFHLVHY